MQGKFMSLLLDVSIDPEIQLVSIYLQEITARRLQRGALSTAGASVKALAECTGYRDPVGETETPHESWNLLEFGARA
jgi:hypothetical protein